MGIPASKEAPSGEMTSFPLLRKEMVERDIAARGVRDELVLDAMRKVPRELFLPTLREVAYEDAPLPISKDAPLALVCECAAGGSAISTPPCPSFVMSKWSSNSRPLA